MQKARSPEIAHTNAWTGLFSGLNKLHSSTMRPLLLLFWAWLAVAVAAKVEVEPVLTPSQIDTCSNSSKCLNAC